MFHGANRTEVFSAPRWNAASDGSISTVCQMIVTSDNVTWCDLKWLVTARTQKESQVSKAPEKNGVN